MAKQLNIKVSQKQYDFLKRNSDKRFLYLYGGAGSAKSWAIAQYLIIEKLYKETNIGILVLRKTKPSVRVSCRALIIYWLKLFSVPYEENKSDLTITAANGNFIKFDSIDDVEKKKSIEGINYIWLEESTEFNGTDFMQLNLRCRAANPNGINQLFFSFNPIDPIGNAWLKSLIDNADNHLDVSGKNDSAVLRVTHKDNPFLAPEERGQIEALASLDAEYDQIYRLGNWATPTNIIYSNWDIVDVFPDTCENVGYGLDFGFVNPTALVRVGVRDVRDVYIDELIYESNLTNPNLIDRMRLEGVRPDEVIVADCAEPARIEELANAGFNANPCAKGPGSVEYGIDCCKRKRLHITARSVNVIKEIQGYKYKTDKSGNVLETPLEFNDHCLIAGTLILTERGQIPIEQVTCKDKVLTRQGWNRVLASAMISKSANVMTVYFSNGASLTGTSDHRVWTKKRGYMPLNSLQCNDVILTWQEINPKLSHTKIFCLGDILLQTTGRVEIILYQVINIVKQAFRDCIRKFGRIFINNQFLRDVIFIISTVIRSIMNQAILNVHQIKNIWNIIVRTCPNGNGNGSKTIYQESEFMHRIGIDRMRAENGIKNWAKCLGLDECLAPCYANIAGKNIKAVQYKEKSDFVPFYAEQLKGEQTALIMNNDCVSIASPSSLATSIPNNNLVPVSVVSISNIHAERVPVYDLTIDTLPEFFANGILVHNSMDAMRYYLSALDSMYGEAEIIDLGQFAELGV